MALVFEAQNTLLDLADYSELVCILIYGRAHRIAALNLVICIFSILFS